jgi:hypothetical protein
MGEVLKPGEMALPLLSDVWLTGQIKKYVEEIGYYNKPSEKYAKELNDKGLSYCEEEFRMLLEGISNNTGISVFDIIKFTEDNNINLKSKALRMANRKEDEDKKELESSNSFEFLEGQDGKKIGYTKKQLDEAVFFGIGGTRAKFRTKKDDPGQNN